MEKDGLFKTCGACRGAWTDWDHFVNDPELRLLGLQAIAGVPDANLLVFEHSCGSSVSVLTKRLRQLLPDHQAANWPSMRGSEECPGHCLHLGDMASCGVHCRNGRDRDLMALVQSIHEARDRRAGSALPPMPPAPLPTGS